MKKFTAILFYVLTLLVSCSTSKPISIWKYQPLYPRLSSKIMVVIMMQDTLLRKQTEAHFVTLLADLGYNSVSAIAEFGYKGLAKLSEEETYQRLCNKGIDAVLIAALLDQSKVKKFKLLEYKDNPNTFYYRRAWNYYKMQAKEAYAKSDKPNADLLLEALFFDLSTLESLYFAQTEPFNSASTEVLTKKYSDAVVNSMVKNKILKKHNKPTAAPLRPF